MCTLCRNQLPLTEYNFATENSVDRIFYGRTEIEKAASFLYYSEDGIVKNLIHNLKYKNQQHIGSFLGEWFGQELKAAGMPIIPELVVPVPLHPKKLRLRGYNQVDLFAKAMADQLGSVFRNDLLVKNLNAKTQTKKDRSFRLKAPKTLFSVRNEDELQNKRILLVDDVITTGATLEACAEALRKPGGVEVFIATMAVVP